MAAHHFDVNVVPQIVKTMAQFYNSLDPFPCRDAGHIQKAEFPCRISLLPRRAEHHGVDWVPEYSGTRLFYVVVIDHLIHKHLAWANYNRDCGKITFLFDGTNG
ncbi:MAG TPA: hypothetical protein VK988_21355 [Acidimicrobiales bacterium]|nr:hypothetical protein [Acidimicrobiales bacterium]